MGNDNIITLIKELGSFSEAIELFFVNFSTGYITLISGFFFISMITLMFWYFVKTKDWVLMQ